MKVINWTKVINKYKGLWVGFKNDNQTVVASRKTPTEVIKKAKLKGYDQPILFRVPTRLVAFATNLADFGHGLLGQNGFFR